LTCQHGSDCVPSVNDILAPPPATAKRKSPRGKKLSIAESLEFPSTELPLGGMLPNNALVSPGAVESMRATACTNMVGFYLVDPTDSGVLLVGPFAGSFTPNARIPLNTGLCGAAARNRETVVVHDVLKDPRYLAGSPLVKGEIVVPIFVRNILAAELDIESYFTGVFTPDEQSFVEACAGVVGMYLGKK